MVGFNSIEDGVEEIHTIISLEIVRVGSSSSLIPPQLPPGLCVVPSHHLCIQIVTILVLSLSVDNAKLKGLLTQPIIAAFCLLNI